MGILIAALLGIVWGILCGLFIRNTVVSVTISLIGGGLLGWYVPGMLGV